MQSEDSIQCAVIEWWGLAHRAFKVDYRLLAHCPNGGKRSAREAAKFKRMGVRAGFPDLMLHVPRRKTVRAGKDLISVEYFALFLELKSAKGSLRPDQKEIHALLKERGYAVFVAWSFEEAVACISNYLVNGDPFVKKGGA